MVYQAQVGLTVCLFLGVWGTAWIPLAWPLFQKFQWRPFHPLAPEKKLLLLLPLYGIAPLLVAAANRYFGYSWSTIGGSFSGASGRSLLLGWGIAVLGLGGVVGLKSLLHLTTFTPSTGEGLGGATGKRLRHLWEMAGLLFVALGISGIEELVFRGWIQTHLETAFPDWGSAALGSALFAIVHLIWEGPEGRWQQPGLWLLGMSLVVARWLDGGSLALAWGLHAGWVWGLAYIDIRLQPRLVAQRPVWLAGRPKQPLTSLLDLGLVVVTVGLLGWGYGLWQP